MEEAPPVPVGNGNATHDAASIWKEILQTMVAEKPLVSTWAQEAVPTAWSQQTLTLSFHPDSKAARDSLSRSNNRSWMESVVSKHVGKPSKLKFCFDESLPPPAPVEAPETTSPGKQPGEGTPAAGTTDTRAPQMEEDFYQDPLIETALRLYADKINQRN
jgi:hypothetical protein